MPISEKSTPKSFTQRAGACTDQFLGLFEYGFVNT